ncbi:ABC transporter permease subunit [Dolichospermum circinale CS-1225]|jgi:ABC-type transport system involved in multi-copper enzyme maturation permease subunit|uniref:ABC transporter permease n=1 Tax=Dolichospermum circinale TaxID=109265 RepID=UPI0003F668D5|nr:ABC transporter permease subunit [Dolichospermum circinale]MDB9459934.1 ABC transporter permease subunit [Dolichospermum circinale CS-545/17]MDB9466620.1 ABC transporter permease subunit [Dolichospermum circinale CS-539/09]MDB9469633.1 ABC transporter permease subunit [Dolichospermum circinale CS-539]MDB9523186.1 ABC transporter permease subunit [Dolichospermum circinale CS-1225]
MNVIRTVAMAKNVFQEVIRDRILYIIPLYALILAIAFRAIPEFTATSSDKIFLDFGLATMNIIGLIVAIFIGTGLVNKEIEKRTILVLIAKPISRSEFIASKYLGLSAIIAVLVVIMTMIYLGFLQIGKISYPMTSIFLATLFMFFQLCLITAVAITLGVFTSSLIATALTYAVYLMGNITQDLLALGKLSSNPTMERITQSLYLILPDLSRLDLKNDAVYGLQALPDTITLIINAVYGLLYSFMLLAFAILIFLRREF